VLPKIKKLQLNGSEVWVLEGDQISEWVEQEGRLDHDQNFLPKILEHIKEGDTVIDVGAFIGDHTIAYASKASKVYAFEPNPAALWCLLHNTMSLDNVGVFRFGLSDREEAQPLSGNNGNYGGAYIGTDQKTADVHLAKLDFFGLKPNFIKIDAEGSELRVLKGAEKTIANHKPKLVIEINEVALGRQNTSPGEIFAWLERHGYTWTVMQENCTMFSPLYDILALPSESTRNGVRQNNGEEGGGPSDLETTLGASISLRDCVKTLQQHAESGKEERQYIMKMLKKAGLYPKR